MAETGQRNALHWRKVQLRPLVARKVLIMSKNKKTVAEATNVETTEAAPAKRERAFPKAVINITVTLSGTSGVTDDQVAAAISLGPNEDPAISVASVEKALRAGLAAAAKSGTMKLRRAKSSGNLVASLPINGAAVTVCPKGQVEKRSDEDRTADALAAFGAALEG